MLCEEEEEEGRAERGADPNKLRAAGFGHHSMEMTDGRHKRERESERVEDGAWVWASFLESFLLR